MTKRLVFISMTVLAFAILAPLPGSANSVTDESGVTWTVSRVFNTSSLGWDIRVTTDENPVQTYWVTGDALGDEDPHLKINPYTNKAWVIWSKQVVGGYRIYHSVFEGTGFSSPAAITSGGTGFSDSQPHFVIETEGEIHLVFYRDLSSGNDRAMYCRHTGSWSSEVQYSDLGHDVIGSTFVKVLDEDLGEIKASYLHGLANPGERCKSGDGSPWLSCD